jgi:uncharacterized membrane protein YfcA
MTFPISGAHIAPGYLIAVGFVVGVLGGLFGVGGSFLVGPALFGFGVPMNFVVGTDLAHVVGKSIVAAKKHQQLGNIDFKLGFLMMIGTIPGVEAGAQLIEHLKRTAHVDKVVGYTFIVVLAGMSGFMLWEGWRNLPFRFRGGRLVRHAPDQAEGDKPRATLRLVQRIQRIGIGPHVSLPVSRIARISVWAIVGVSVVGGFMSGFLGGGAGYLRMPSMIYLLGVPTHVAIGTDLFEIIASAGYGTLTHAIKGNVDILIALVMHTGAAIGAQFGAILTAYVSGPTLRLAFVPLLLLGAAVILHGLHVPHPPGGG